MKPQKKNTRSIRDFFAPASQGLQGGSRPATPQQRGAHASLSTESSASSDPQGQPSATTTAASHPTSSIPSAIPSTATQATSPEAQLPVLSQTSANSGASKRVVSNGQQVVLNSDSDTDSLPDLDFGDVPAPKSKSTTQTTRSRFALDNSEDVLRKPPKKLTRTKQPFSLLVETARENRDLEQEIIEGKAELDRLVEVPVKSDVAIDEQALGQVVSDDEDSDKAHRLYLAMQRTNATQMDAAFHFFHDASDSHHLPLSFPRQSLPNHRWASVFEDPSTRDQAFLTGFAHQIFRIRELPQELASWTIDQICVGRNESLDYKYLELLEFHHQYLPDLLNRDRLDDMFRTIGADVKSLSSKDGLKLSVVSHTASKLPIPDSLRSIVRLLERAAPWLHTKTKCHALYILSHVCMDDSVSADADVLQHVQDAIEAIMCQFTDERKLTTGVGRPPTQDKEHSLIASQLSDLAQKLLPRVTHPILQRNLIRAFPVKSPLTAYFQRHLALSFLLYPTLVDVPLADPKILTLIHTHLNTSKHYQIRKNTDYDLLAARLTLLDIAIGPGPLSVPYQPLLSPAPSQAGSSPVMAPFPESAQVKHFNQAVDNLAQHVKMLSNSIMEAGAAVDLAILDAKDCSERLCARLEHAVRIGGRKVDNVFGGDDDEGQLKLSRFFVKKGGVDASAVGGGVKGIFDEEEDGGLEKVGLLPS
ncbi:hypothetical protein P153DRAFT_384080 [Dothidotthia symphoricarpi CBS 119687]|uniref:Uncharacterized protein n=1 Tax=Dothidotthia symphoricarpi CBS 119687 TaxID=1392245 RepID=A0A6A6AG22_9PLEO|nr:uncharacterized protein P153DRAFT_384080 [Dothidotthia symphoricarpi CBS 119687]KAF2130859.1 hypothetical protein P153DRAFT_384080 [Dothidotthia symphoricarpi CBS 119687]